MLLVGERTNANGSKKFREAMLREDWDTCVAMARDQISEGAHILDVCVDYTGADGVVGHGRAHGAARDPVLRPADGRHDRGTRRSGGARLDRGPGAAQQRQPRGGRRRGHAASTRSSPLAREFGAAVVATCIDEEGQARTAEWKVRAASRDRRARRGPLRALRRGRLHRPARAAARRPGSRSRGATASRRSRRSAGISTSCPASTRSSGSRTSRSGSTPARARRSTRCSCTSAREAGLDAAIVHASKILPLAQDRRAGARRVPRPHLRPSPRRLRPAHGAPRAVRGRRARLATTVDDLEGLDVERAPVTPHHRREPQRARRRTSTRRSATGSAPLAIVNDHLLEGMRVVGDLFATGEMQLPVRAAERRDDEAGRLATSSRTWSGPTRGARARSCSRP